MSPAPASPLVSMQGIVKRFGSVTALDGVDFDLNPGEIHALLGENGAGKSTLMQILSGVHRADSGSILMNGSRMRFRSAGEAASAGIGMVHQHFMLVDQFSVAENLALGLGDRAPALLPRRGLAQQALDLAESLGWKLDPEARVWQLPVGAQQRIEIVKLLALDPRVLIFDEPTAVLAPTELDELFSVIRRLKAEGKGIVFISHKLSEVMELCDRVTVLRHGKVVCRVDTAGTSAGELAREMVGAAGELETAVLPEEPAAGKSLLEAEDLCVLDDRGLPAVRQVSFQLSPGEILGIAGVDGNGQLELGEALAGLRRVASGRILYDGKPAPPGGPPRAELGYIPQDRRRDGLATSLSVRDNLVLELHQEPSAGRGPFLNWRYLNEAAAAMMREFDVRASGPGAPAASLSGGNQQKIVIARALYKKPRLLLALNPSRGVDVGATAYIHQRLRDEAARGAAVLLISTELDELLQLSHRIAVMYAGRIAGIVPRGTPRETIGLMMGGQATAGAA